MRDPNPDAAGSAGRPGAPEGGADVPHRPEARALARAFHALVALVFGLIVLGALVRARGAGLACPDWPLCFGELIPPLDFHVGFEWAHRVAAGGISLLFLGLAFAVLRRPRLRSAVGGLVLLAAGLLALQVVLGGLTVLHLLADWSVTAHLVTGNAFAVTLLLIARGLADAAEPRAPRPRTPTAVRALLGVVAAILFAQIVIGGLVSSRYAGLACADWPACAGGVYFPSFEGAVGLHLLHRMNSYLLLAALLVAAAAARGLRPLATRLRFAVALGGIQVALGVANVLLALPVEVTALHSAGAAALVLTMTLALRDAWSEPAALRAPAGAAAASAEALSGPPRPRVVVVGAGFGGLAAVRGLSRVPVDVLWVDRNNYHAFLPLLYQVATSGLSAQDVTHPARAIARGMPNVRFQLAEIAGADLADGELEASDGRRIRFDHLVLAAGSVTEAYGNASVEKHAYGLHDVDDALLLRNHVLSCLERAETLEDPAARAAMLGFVVVGGGPTGVELAGALAELASHVVPHDFPQLAGGMRVVLLEGRDRLLGGMPEKLQQRALAQVRGLGVEVRLESLVERVEPGGVSLRSGEWLPAHTVIWAAGVRGAGLAQRLGIAAGRAGRVPVEATLALPDHPNVYVVGDLALVKGDEALPQVAPVAMQQGALAADNIARRLRGEPQRSFRYRDRGTMATVGRNRAVAHVFGLELSGRPAWWAWLLVHIAFLAGFRNRAAVFVNWAYNFFTYDRGLRAMVGGRHRGH